MVMPTHTCLHIWAWWVAGWPESDNKTISVQLDLTWTGTGTELGNTAIIAAMDMAIF